MHIRKSSISSNFEPITSYLGSSEFSKVIIFCKHDEES